jgi:hypothetical protein
MPFTTTGTVNVIGNFQKVYGLPSNISVTLAGTGQGHVESTCERIYCGDGYNYCSATVNSGNQSYVRLIAVADNPNTFTGWTGCPSPNGTTCNIPARQNANVTATFAAPPTYTVTPSAGAGGSISPNTPQTVVLNSVLSFTVTPNYGYGIASVTGCGGALSENTYTTGPITGNCSVYATFAVLPTYTITSSAGSNGSISPTSTTVYYGSSVTLKITPASGYKLTRLTDNGVDVTSYAAWNSSLQAYYYTISSVTSNHTVQATFGIGSPGPVATPALSTSAIFLLTVILGGILLSGRKERLNQ